jgi:hypothetical protein
MESGIPLRNRATVQRFLESFGSETKFGFSTVAWPIFGENPCNGAASRGRACFSRTDEDLIERNPEALLPWNWRPGPANLAP